MPSLRQLLAAHPPLLLIDSTSARIQVGYFASDPDSARWAGSAEEAGIGIFRCLEALGLDLAAVRAFAFADAPGSVLGVRTAAMALRVWCALAPRPVFAYNALAAAAEGLGRDDVTLIADARRDAWHACRRGGQLRRVTAAELSGPLAMPDGFKHWKPLPAGTQSVPYVLSELWPRIADADLLQGSDAPDAFVYDGPSYVTWTPQVHRPA